MKKLALTLFGCIALVAFMGMSGSASALPPGDCDGDPYPNDPLMHELAIDTPDSHAAHDVSGTTFGWLVCGTDIGSWPNGAGSQYVLAQVLTAPGTGFAGLRSYQPDQTDHFVGNGRVSILTWKVGAPGRPALRLNDIPITLTIDNGPLTDCPLTAIACYKVTTDVGILNFHFWSWVTKVSTFPPRYKLNIGEFYNTGDPTNPQAGWTRVLFNFCDRVGRIGGTVYPADCGGAGQPQLGNNGDVSAPDCNGGAGPNGIYTAMAKMRDGRTTPQVQTCVAWTPFGNPKPGLKNATAIKLP